jgi:hypothetical protein
VDVSRRGLAPTAADETPGPRDPDELDGVLPPPGCDGPTLVVWREYGTRMARLKMAAIALFVYATMGGFIVVVRPGIRHGTDPIVLGVYLVCCATLHWWIMTARGGTVYAAGDTWFVLVGRRYRAVNPPICKSDELRRVRFAFRRRMTYTTKMVRLINVHDRYIEFQLPAVQSCPPLAALLQRAMFAREDLVVADGIREALSVVREGSAAQGTTVVRPGFTW